MAVIPALLVNRGFVVLGSLISLFVLSGCDRLQEGYDFSGKFKDCQIRFTASKAVEDADLALESGNPLFITRDLHGYASVTIVPGIKACDPVRTSPLERELGIKAMFAGESHHFINTPAAFCSESIHDYEITYNKHMMLIRPKNGGSFLPKYSLLALVSYESRMTGFSNLSHVSLPRRGHTSLHFTPASDPLP